MSFRKVALIALFAAAPALATVDAGLGVDAEPLGAGALGAHLSPEEIKAGGGADLLGGAVDLGAGADVKLPQVPARHRRRAGLTDNDLGALGVNNIVGGLTSSVSPVLNTLTSLVDDVTAPAEQIVSQVESQLTKLTGLLDGGLTDLQGLTGGALQKNKNIDTTQAVPSNEAVANTIADLTNSVGQTLQTLNGVAGDIPGLGAVLQPVLQQVEGQLSGVVGIVGQVAAPVLEILKPLLAPVEQILNGLGLGAVTGILDGVL